MFVWPYLGCYLFSFRWHSTCLLAPGGSEVAIPLPAAVNFLCLSPAFVTVRLDSNVSLVCV